MSSLEAALDQHLRIADKTYDEWEEYLAALEDIPEEYIEEKENGDESNTNPNTKPGHRP